MNLRRDRVPLGERDLLRICYLYYREEKTQEEISSIFGLSRFKVNRLLKEARNRGLVTIQINDPLENLTEAEVELTKRFDLKEAIVVRLNRLSGRSPLEQIGEAGAQYLTHIIRDYRALGISWGRTLYHLVENVKSVEVKGLAVVQISGGLGTIEGTDTNILTMTLSQRLGGTAYVIPAPVIVKNREIRETFLREGKIREALSKAKEVDLAILGIGVVDRDGGLWKAGFLNHSDEARLRKAGAVGAICGHFYDRQGQMCSSGLEDRIIGLTLDELKRVRHKIGVAMSPEKSHAILGALRGGLLNALITDEETAERVLAES
ncbi:MAG: sugar-binding transcriptional regulator [Deltaproteobacteria bacterium]|nr:MAG: sugar-binding transcriptional regulator [Deltaproteobacteria bacterium]